MVTSLFPPSMTARCICLPTCPWIRRMLLSKLVVFMIIAGIVLFHLPIIWFKRFSCLACNFALAFRLSSSSLSICAIISRFLMCIATCKYGIFHTTLSSQLNRSHRLVTGNDGPTPYWSGITFPYHPHLDCRTGLPFGLRILRIRILLRS